MKKNKKKFNKKKVIKKKYIRRKILRLRRLPYGRGTILDNVLQTNIELPEITPIQQTEISPERLALAEALSGRRII